MSFGKTLLRKLKLKFLKKFGAKSTNATYERETWTENTNATYEREIWPEDTDRSSNIKQDAWGDLFKFYDYSQQNKQGYYNYSQHSKCFFFGLF